MYLTFEKIFLLCFVEFWCFICVVGFPTCIFYKKSVESGPHSKMSLCKIAKIQCSSDAIPPRKAPIAPKIAVCLSEEGKSCMLSWDIENHDSQTSFYCLLAMKEYDIMSTNQSLYCYNVSIDDVSSSASVTVLTELQPHKGIPTVIETSLTQHSPLDIPTILVGNTVWRTGKDNTCEQKDTCPPGSELKVAYGRTECAGDMGRTRVDVSVPDVNFRNIQLVVGSRLTTCQGIMRHCVYNVEKKYGGRFRLEITLILADNRVCKYSKMIPSQICGDPGDPSNSTSLITSSVADKKAPYLPTYAYVLLALACSGVFAVLITISCFIFHRLRRDGCPRRGPNRSINNQNTLESFHIEGNDEEYTEIEITRHHRKDNQSDSKEDRTLEKLPFRDSIDEDIT